MKQRLLRLFIIPTVIFCLLFCGCDSGGSAAVGTDASGNPVSPTNTKDKSGRFETVITELVDGAATDDDYITGVKTYERLQTECALTGYIRCIWGDGDYLYAVIGRGLHNVLVCTDRDGKLVSERTLPDYDFEHDVPWYACVLPDGSLITVCSLRNNRELGLLRLFDADDNFVCQVDMPEACQANTSIFSASVTEAADGGYRIVMRFPSAILVLDETLEIQHCTSLDFTPSAFSYCGEDIYWVAGNHVLYQYHAGTGELTKAEFQPLAKLTEMENYCFDGDGNIYCSNRSGLYRIIDDDYNIEPLLEWINGSAVYSYGNIIIDPERMYSNQKKQLGNQYEYVLLDCTKENPFPKPRRIIEIGLLGTGYNQLIQETVSLFNTENDEYFIRLIDYDVYGDEVASVFEEQVFAGATPDILISLPYQLEKLALDKYTSKNLIVDLNPLYGDSLLGAVRYAMSEGERMWSLPVGMTVSTYAAARSVSDGPLTLDAFYQMADKLSGHGGVAEVQPDNGMRLETDENGNTVIVMGLATPNNDFPFEGEVITSNHYTIQTIFENGLYEFVDFENKDASFDSQEFCHFIEYLKRVDEDYVHINAGSLTPSGECGYKMDTSYLRENLLQGKLQLLPVSFNNIGLYPALKRLYGDGEVPFVLCGYPSSEGCGAKINTNCLVTVMADSTVHGGCKAFLDFLLSDRVQTSDNMINTNLPVTLSGLSGAIDRYRYFYYVRNAGDRIEPVAISDVPLEEYTTDFAATYNIEVVITDEDKAAMMDFFENCHMRADSDPVITAIVEEELWFWNGGARTLEETAKIIQSRVWIYLNE